MYWPIVTLVTVAMTTLNHHSVRPLHTNTINEQKTIIINRNEDFKSDLLKKVHAVHNLTKMIDPMMLIIFEGFVLKFLFFIFVKV